MDFIVLGGDARMPALAELLRKEGYSAWHMSEPESEALSEARRVVVNCPPKCVITMEALLAQIPETAPVYLCGPASWDDPRVTDLWRDETLQLDNARLTAEGAVSAAMRAGGRCIHETRALVIGWGRIGRALNEILVALGAKVTVASRQQSHRHRAIERGAEAVSLADVGNVLPGVDLVYNTAPSMVLGEEALRCVNGKAMLIDLASPPYGIDLSAAWKLSLRAWREPGLPGRYCPESAAAALYRALMRGGDFRG